MSNKTPVEIVSSLVPDWRRSAGGGMSLSQARAMSPAMMAFATGADVSDNGAGATLVNAYQQSTWVYTAVSRIAEQVAQIPFRISRVGRDNARRLRAMQGETSDPRYRAWRRRVLGEKIVESGEVVELFRQPHWTMNGSLFWKLIATWECLRGEFFVVPLDKNEISVDLRTHPRIAQMLTLAPDLFWHIVKGYELDMWRYTGSPLLTPLASQMLRPSEVIYERMVNIGSYWRGMSPLSVAMLPASTDYAAGMFMKGLIMNNADTGIIATTEQQLSQEQREQFVAALRERKRKAGTPDRPLFLSSGVKIEKPTISNVDMQFLETRRFSMQEIGSIYNVPPSIMGFSQDKATPLSGGGDALNEEKLTFIEHNIGPRCCRYEQAMAPVVQSFGEDLVGWFDVEILPVMQAARRARVDTASKMFAMGVPLNDLNQVYDLGFPDYKWGRKGFLPFNLQPADALMDMPSEDDPTDTTPSDKPTEEEPIKAVLRVLREGEKQKAESVKAEFKASMAALWQKHMRSREGTVRLFKGKVARVLNEFRAKALAKLSEIQSKSGVGAGALPPQSKALVDTIFDANEFGKALRLILERPQKDALNTAGKAAREEVGATDPWEMPPAKVQEFLESREQPIMGVGGTVRDRINTTLTAGTDAGETTEELAGRVKEVFTDLTKGEATRVARTETAICFNSARHDALTDAGIEYKSWLSAHVNVRLGHQMAEKYYMENPIPMEEPFIVDLGGVGEQLMFPGDDSLGASPGNIINCMCVQLAARQEGEDEKSVTFYIYGLGIVRFEKASNTKQIGHICQH